MLSTGCDPIPVHAFPLFFRYYILYNNCTWVKVNNISLIHSWPLVGWQSANSWLTVGWLYLLGTILLFYHVSIRVISLETIYYVTILHDLVTHPSTCLRSSLIRNLWRPVALIRSVLIPASDSSFMENISAVVPMAASSWLWLMPYLEDNMISNNKHWYYEMMRGLFRDENLSSCL